MGLILPQTVKVRTNPSNCKHYKEKGYEFKKCGDFIEVNVLDLPKGSTVKVKVVCDICGHESEVLYCYVNKNISNGTLITCRSNSCTNKKREDTNLERYGHICSLQSEEAKKKTKDTCMKKYGVDNPFGSKEIQNKSKKTCQSHFGCEYPTQSKIVQDKLKKTFKNHFGCNNPMQYKVIQDKAKATCKERYGVEYGAQSETIKNKAKITCQKKYGGNSAMCSEEIQNKSKITCKERYGVEYAMQNEEIKNKMLNSFQFNGTGPCSRAQKYIHFLIGGVLNKRVCNSLVDICFEEEKIAIEYDGGGHFLGELMINEDRSISKEAILREKNREDSIVNKGYKVIRFIATKDRIPSDEIILNLVNEFKNSNFKVVRIDFEEGTIDRDYKEKSHHNFGELRKITKKDLEQFESKKQ